MKKIFISSAMLLLLSALTMTAQKNRNNIATQNSISPLRRELFSCRLLNASEEPSGK